MNKLFAGGLFGVFGILAIVFGYLVFKRKDLGDAFNPASDENVVYKGTNKLVEVITDGEETSLGGLFSKWFPSAAEKEVNKTYGKPVVKKPEPEPDTNFFARLRDSINIFNDVEPVNEPPLIGVEKQRKAPVMPSDLFSSSASRAATPPFVNPFGNKPPELSNLYYIEPPSLLKQNYEVKKDGVTVVKPGQGIDVNMNRKREGEEIGLYDYIF